MPTKDTSWADKYGGVTPYYPQQRYIDENLAPEVGLPNMHLEALAAANQEALKNGLMSPKLAAKMLPNILTEGAMGINGWGYADMPKYRAILEKAGLPPTIQEIEQLRREVPTEFDRELINAKLVHALTAAKASLYGEDKAIERWNGQGKSASYARPADAENHARKVAELERLMSHPKNKPMADYWAAMSARYAGTPPQQMTEAPPAYSWADENLPGMFAAPVNAMAGYATETKNALHRTQDAFRNWTAR
jgi:hypothetical protein